MASFTISPIWGAGAQLFDNNGNPLTGGLIYTYFAGTSTPAATYTTPSGNIANSNPIVANAAGRLANEIWLPISGAYKFVLKDANDVLIATYDNIPTLPQPPVVNDAYTVYYEQGYTVNAGNFTIGATYLITSVGNTDFVAIGASSNNTGVHFVATGIGSGTGTAEYSRTVQSKLQESISAKDFGAVGDGVTDDTAAIQAAIDYSYANNVDLFIPSGTYELSTHLVWNGSNIFGEGENNTIINGAPDCDVFYSPDYSIGETGSVSSFRQNAHMSDMTINVNNSGTKTYPDATFNRPLFPVTGNWSASLNVLEGQYYKAANNFIYKCIKSGVTSSVSPTHTFGTETDGTVTWLYISYQQFYVGNAGIAIPSYDGSANVPNVLHSVFKNLRIVASGSSSNLATACIYSQLPFYDCTFENQIWRFTQYGYLNIAPTTNFASYEYAPDASVFNKIAMFCQFPFISFNSNYSTMVNCQFYANNLYWQSAYLLGYKSANRINCQGWNLVNFYCEPNSSTTGAIGIIDGNNHIISGGALKSSFGTPYYVFVGNNSTIQSNYIGNDGVNPMALLYGNYNTFTAITTSQATLSNIVIDKGLGNIVEIGTTVSASTLSERQQVALPGTVRNPYGIRQNDWLVKNCATTPFYDMLFGGREFTTPNTSAINVSDATLETGGYIRNTNGLGFFSSAANRQTLDIGSRIPAGKVQVLVKGRLSLSTTATISLQANPPVGAGVSLASITPTWSTSWQVFEIDVDLSSYSGYTLQINFNNPASTSNYYDIAWVAVVPFSVANTIVKNKFFSGIIDCEGTGSPEGVVTANVGSTYRRIDGGAGTAFYVKESGTGNTGWVAK